MSTEHDITRRELLKSFPQNRGNISDKSVAKTAPEKSYIVKSATRAYSERALELVSRRTKTARERIAESARTTGSAALTAASRSLGSTSPHANEKVFIKPRRIADYKFDGTDIPAGSGLEIYVPSPGAAGARLLGLFDKAISTKPRRYLLGALAAVAAISPFAYKEAAYGDSVATANTVGGGAKICTDTERTPIGPDGSLKTVLGQARVSNGQLAHVQVERHSADIFPGQPDRVLETVPAAEIIATGQATRLQPSDVVIDTMNRTC